MACIMKHLTRYLLQKIINHKNCFAVLVCMVLYECRSLSAALGRSVHYFLFLCSDYRTNKHIRATKNCTVPVSLLYVCTADLFFQIPMLQKLCYILRIEEAHPPLLAHEQVKNLSRDWPTHIERQIRVL